MQVIESVLFRVMIAEFRLQRVTGENDGLLVIASQSALNHVQFELKEIMVASDFIAQETDIVNIKPLRKKADPVRISRMI